MGRQRSNSKDSIDTPANLILAYRMACDFYLTALEIAKTSYIYPMVMNSAFSLELFLKLLVRVEDRRPPEQHDLRTLFNRLSPGSQDAIRERYQSMLEAPPVAEILRRCRPTDLPKDYRDHDMDWVLRRAAEAFEEYRYVYEGKRKAKTWVGARLVPAVQHRILQLRPDLRTKFEHVSGELSLPFTAYLDVWVYERQGQDGQPQRVIAKVAQDRPKRSHPFQP